ARRVARERGEREPLVVALLQEERAHRGAVHPDERVVAVQSIELHPGRDGEILGGVQDGRAGRGGGLGSRSDELIAVRTSGDGRAAELERHRPDRGENGLVGDPLEVPIRGKLREQLLDAAVYGCAAGSPRRAAAATRRAPDADRAAAAAQRAPGPAGSTASP